MAKKLGEFLVSESALTNDQLQEALEEQSRSKDFLGKILIAKGFLTEDQLVDALVRQPGISKVDLDRVNPDPALAKMIPENVARKRGCLPVQQDGNMLQVAFLDPLDDKAIDFLSQMSGLTIQACAAAPGKFETALERFYEGVKSGGDAAQERRRKDVSAKPRPTGEALDQLVEHAIQEISDADLDEDDSADKVKCIALEIEETDAPIIRIANGIILRSLDVGSSDIHVEPQEEHIRIRYRVDGALRTFFKLPASIKNPVISRLKIMGEMDVAEHRIPQDGRIKLEVGGGEMLDLRVNTLPGVLGEKIVMRLLGTGQLKGRVAELGFSAQDLEAVENALMGHFGMILVTGPTGSGKTTSLYTMLNQVNTEEVNIVTAEDPVEYNLPGIHQVAVRPQIGFSFDVALRSFLRQDPDIILVGEMRDYETAAIAIKAALTGHLVLSTLHTNDAPSTVVRLVDMGIEPYLVASAVKLVIAQRLVRKICESCKETVPASDAEKTDLSESVLSSIEALFHGKGCPECNNTGNKGRIPIFEVMAVRSREMRRVITEGGTEVQVAHVGRKEGLRTLRDSALALMNKGDISLEEGIRVALSD